MNNLRSIISCVFSQSLLLMVLAFFSFSVFAQQSKEPALTKQSDKPALLSPFDKLKWLDCNPKDDIQKKVLYEYGAVYLSKAFSRQTEQIPCWFNNEEAVGAFIEKLTRNPANKFDFGEFYLQPQAKASLLMVFKEMSKDGDAYRYVARNCNEKDEQLKAENCTNKINNDWSLRTFGDTVYNWFKYRKESLKAGEWDNWFNSHKDNLTSDDWTEIKNAVVNPSSGNQPKMFTYAIPGGSQHHFGLAIDVNNGSDSRVCGDACVKSLENHGWYRTVRYDRFHYTYLGYPERELRIIGLKKVQCSDTFTYWVPKAIEGYNEQKKPVFYKGFKNWECEDVK